MYAGHMPAGSSVQNIIHWLQVNLPRFLPVPHRAALLPCGQPAVLLAARHTFVRSSLVLLSPPPQNARQISERSGPKGVGLSRETRGAEDPASASGPFQGPCFRPAPLLPCSPSAVDSSQLSLLPIKLIISPSSPCGHENSHHQSPLTLQLCSAALLFSSPS